MSTKNIYVITGATGNIGSKITQILLSKGAAVRAIGRSADKLKNLTSLGAEACVGSVADVAFLTKTFSGSTAVFAMIPPNYASTNSRAEQNAVSQALFTAVKNSAVRFVVSLSSIGANQSHGGGPINGLHDHESRFLQLTETNVLHLRPAYFMENLLGQIGLIKNMNMMGSAMNGDIKIPMIATKDIAQEAAARLLSLDFKGHGVKELQGERDLSFKQVAVILGRAAGKDNLSYTQFSYEDTEKALVQMGFSQNVAELFSEMSKGFNDGHIKPTAPRSAENTTATSIEEFAQFFASVYNAKSPAQNAH